MAPKTITDRQGPLQVDELAFPRLLEAGAAQGLCRQITGKTSASGYDDSKEGLVALPGIEPGFED